jgi:hypothetical protein
MVGWYFLLSCYSIFLSYIIILDMDKDKPRPAISRPLTETELIENMLNIGDISEITPEPSEEA